MAVLSNLISMSSNFIPLRLRSQITPVFGLFRRQLSSIGLSFLQAEEMVPRIPMGFPCKKVTPWQMQFAFMREFGSQTGYETLEQILAAEQVLKKRPKIAIAACKLFLKVAQDEERTKEKGGEYALIRADGNFELTEYKKSRSGKLWEQCMSTVLKIVTEPKLPQPNKSVEVQVSEALVKHKNQNDLKRALGGGCKEPEGGGKYNYSFSSKKYLKFFVKIMALNDNEKGVLKDKEIIEKIKTLLMKMD